MTRPAGTVLVIDDNELNRLILAAHIERDGHTALLAASARQAFEILSLNVVDVILLDLMMPDVDGFQVLERLKADLRLRHIPVIVVSAIDEIASVARSIEMGATDHLSKPVDAVILRARLRASLTAKRLHDGEQAYLGSVSQLTSAAVSLEGGDFDPDSLANLIGRDDALGRLARVFQEMARQVDARERRLRQQNQFTSALVGKITHELRSPFAAAGFSVQLLRRYAEHGMTDELLAQVELLDRQLSDGRRMIDGLIAFAAFMAKRTELRLRETDVARLLADTVAPLGRFARTRRVTIEQALSASMPPALIDPDQIGEAVQHLLHNAIKFNREGGRVKLSCQIVGRRLTLLVEDSGVGVAPEKLALVWDAFEQAGDDVERGVEGLGIGLALVRYVVHAHGGDVIARSTPGEGSTFGFTLPLP